MKFQSVLVFLHVVSLVMAIASFAVLLRQLGMRTLSDANKAVVRSNVRITSYVMLLSLFTVCFTSGALLCNQLLLTSALPPMALLAIRTLSLGGAVAASIAIHTLAMPMVKRSSGRKIVDSAPASSILACTLAVSLAILCWAIFILSNTHPGELQSWRAGVILPSLATILSLLWIMLSLCLLGERGLFEIRNLAIRVKKALEPPTRIEVQRANRARRMNSMNLPMAPRRKASA